MGSLICKDICKNTPGSDSWTEPAETATAEEKIRKSVFIATLAPCRTLEEVRSEVARVGDAYKNATHNCWACRLGPNPEIEHSSDAGEPAGTAGRPILSAIRQSGMFNLTIIVTRWFGGIRLGVRGLIEAYGGIAAAVAAKAARVERIHSKRLVISLSYAIIGEVTHLLSANGMVGTPVWSYGEFAEVVAEIRGADILRMSELLNELQARGKICSWSWILHN